MDRGILERLGRLGVAALVLAATSVAFVSAQQPTLRQPLSTTSPLADPRGAAPIADEGADRRDKPFRTVFYDPTTENRDLFSTEPLPPVERGPSPDFAPEDDTCNEAAPKLPSGAKPGIVQQLLLSETFLAGGNSPDSLGINEIAFRGTLGLPFFTIQSPLLISPGFTMHLLDGPQALDVPPRLYEAFVEFRHLRRLTPKLGMDLAVMPGVFSDLNRVGSQSIRIQGRALGAYDWSERLRLVAGVLYLDRDDIRLLPAGGAIWTPNDDARFELVFPRPRIARRIAWTEESSWWVYLLGELGGNSYGVTMADGTENTLTYLDYRVMLGIERKVTLKLGAYFETGYVFGRQLEYLTGSSSINPPSTVLVRGGLLY